MKRILGVVVLLCMLICSTAYADDFADLQTQREGIALNIEIVQLNIRLAQLNGDAVAQAAAEAELARLEEQDLQLRAQMLLYLDDRQDELDAQRADLEAQIAALQAQLASLEIEQEQLTQQRQQVLSVQQLTGSARGFQSDVRVTLTVTPNGTIASVEIDASGESRGIGTRVMDDAQFARQFAGMSLPISLSDVDVLSGATFSSRAVVNAINAAAENCVFESVEDSQTSRDDHAIKEEMLDNAYTQKNSSDVVSAVSQAPGFAGQPVFVALTLDRDGAISAITIDVSKQLPPMCDLVLQDDFINQFIGQTGPFRVGENVDLVTGATFTSEAVISVVNQIIEDLN